ncbi:methyltransferase domain-containing protein [Virgibacillus sp. NKC19-3]|uniref:class I SAM-dependent DNA methyltransferase n=1 Tax=Virgibacillus saliphilus TaxID=2831674 RepID=UPI001C9B8F9F|nr:class I SAM-dependent methyltransferase [Virgibacillus sp. NKC19-3]MBY7143008.1 methyltransferase domain-containing protein [Virgibacillus sp. NKC19-3]
MGREFLDIFDEWAKDYDTSVAGLDPQYEEVFKNYENILNEVVQHSAGTVLEFGVGTGNLTEKLLRAGHQVIGVEPSYAMREIASAKLSDLTLLEGDFITFPKVASIETIVSTYAFHHLTDHEKDTAIRQFAEILPENGKIVFGDTMFTSIAAKESMIEAAETKGFTHLAEDLRREYYPTIDVLQNIFVKHHFDVTFNQENNFVWIVKANKRKRSD